MNWYGWRLGRLAYSSLDLGAIITIEGMWRPWFWRFYVLSPGDFTL